MEEQFERFPHLARGIFNQLDDLTLTACQEVSPSWNTFIEGNNMPWNRILYLYPPGKGQFFRSTEGGKAPPQYTILSELHIAAFTGQIKTFCDLSSNLAKINPEMINPINEAGVSPLHKAAEMVNTYGVTSSYLVTYLKKPVYFLLNNFQIGFNFFI